MLPIRLEEVQTEELIQRVRKTSGYTLNIDLRENQVSSDDGLVFRFEVEEFRHHCLLNGLDDIGLTMQNKHRIRQYEETHPVTISR